MSPPSPRGSDRPAPALLIVRSPTGAENRLRIEPLPFRIGRQNDNDLVLRDNRASRYHARIVAENGGYAVEDLKSSYGVFLNGQRVEQAPLHAGDRIEFGAPDSYRLTFELGQEHATTAGGATALAKLCATLEVARALQSSLSIDNVLSAVVDAALTITGCERGFLLLRDGEDLDVRVARSQTGPLTKTDLCVPTRLLWRALRQRREFLSMNFESGGEALNATELSVYNLELRSVVCVPLVAVRAGSVERTSTLTAADDTVGLLYMDSRAGHADLSSGGRELLTTLALEASTVLENARLIEQQWASQRIEQELQIARQIQQSLLPRALPVSGWFRAAASSIPSLEVGGDYVDIRRLPEGRWAAVTVDVSGKGVGAAILASLLQGMFVVSTYSRLSVGEMFSRVNQYLNERTGGEQYATAFFCILGSDGRLRWVNAGHPPAIVLRASGALEYLEAGGTPLGMLEDGEYPVAETQLQPGDRIVVYSDGVIEAQNRACEAYGLRRLCRDVAANAAADTPRLHQNLLAALETFTEREPQRDDVTLSVLEFHGL